MSQADDTATVPSQPDLLKQARKEASGPLFALALLQVLAVVGTLMPLLLGAVIDRAVLTLVLAGAGGLGVLAAGLGIWARFRPLPAAAVGLALFAVLMALTVVSAFDHFGLGSAIQLAIQVALAAILVKSIRTSLRLRRASGAPDGRLVNGADGEGVGDAHFAPGAKK